MKVCYICGALYLTVHADAPRSCQACTRAGDNGEMDYMGVYLIELTPEERKALWHWLAQYEEGDGR